MEPESQPKGVRSSPDVQLWRRALALDSSHYGRAAFRCDLINHLRSGVSGVSRLLPAGNGPFQGRDVRAQLPICLRPSAPQEALLRCPLRDSADCRCGLTAADHPLPEASNRLEILEQAQPRSA